MKDTLLRMKNFLVGLKNAVWQATSFALLIFIYAVGRGADIISGSYFFPLLWRRKMQPSCVNLYNKATGLLMLYQPNSISRISLIKLSIKNMKAKKTRTWITIGGMTIGIGAIVLLVSIGYGLEKVVITRVANLEEMKQSDVSPQPGGITKITDKTLTDFAGISEVQMALPLISAAGKVNYQNSVSDVAVYGVTSDYLNQSAIKPVEGKIFESNETSVDLSNLAEIDKAPVNDAVGKIGDKIQDVNFSINPGKWVAVRSDPSSSGKIIGYSKRLGDSLQGEEIYGETYESSNGNGEYGKTEDGKSLGKWINASVLLWKQQKCDTKSEGDCEDGKYMVLRDSSNAQVKKEGYFSEDEVALSSVNIAKSAKVSGSIENVGNSEWVNVPSESQANNQPETKIINLANNSGKEAVVNTTMLSVLGIKESEAVGQKFKVSFVIVGDLLANPRENIQSSETEYTIVGVVPEEKNPIFYVPFIDLRSLGVVNFSQVKLVVKDQNELAKVRKQVESMGYTTHSVVDTVAQIDSLFSTARVMLMLVGAVALAVASLGMFNTLTVSLLERTREVGLMKAIGMKSSEVQELFLTESMIMGFSGGILGVIVGWLLGKLISVVLSFVAIFKGVGFIDISYIPPTFLFSIIALSLAVGMLTGIYPARRATKISALNALRYE